MTMTPGESHFGYPPDYHMHTPLCHHAEGEPVEYAARAVELGLTEIGFSEHNPMREDDFDDWRMRVDQLDEYAESVKAAQRDFPQLTIRVSGYAVNFIKLTREQQLDVINRTFHERM